MDSQIVRFTRALVITGGWLEEVVTGVSYELAGEGYRDRNPRDVVFDMLVETLAVAFHPVDWHDLKQATDLIDRAAARVEEHLRRHGTLAGLIDDEEAAERFPVSD